MDFNDSAKMLEVADDTGEDEFGNTFRLFFFASDVQDISAARVYSQQVKYNYYFLNLLKGYT